MKIIIPMAGKGSRFADCGYDHPKPFIMVNGKPMILRVIENLNIKGAKFILIGQNNHLKNYKKIIKNIENNYSATFLPIDSQTDGAAMTILFARQLMKLNEEVVIANSDQIIDNCFEDFIKDARKRCLDGAILSFLDKEKNSKWSFVKLNSNKMVTEVKEKKAISNIATVGIYYFKKVELMIDGIIQMIIENDRVNNEFYVCPVYNYLIRNKKSVGIFNIKQNQMNSLGTPQDLDNYLSKISKKT